MEGTIMAEKIKITNGTYKEDDPHKEIGYQKWRVRKTHEVIMEYEIVAKTKQEADELLEKNECINVEKIDEYGDTINSSIKGQSMSDFSGDEPVEWEKIGECLPTEEKDYDTNKIFLNYDDPVWSSHDFEWVKNEDGTKIQLQEKPHE